MKIGFDARALPFFGGIATYSRELIRAVARALPSGNVKLFTRNSARKVRELQAMLNDAPIEYAPILPHSLMLGRTFEPMFRQLQDAILRRQSCTLDILHLTDPDYFFEDCPNIAVTIHDLFWMYPDAWISNSLKQRLAPRGKSILQHACAIFTPSAFVRDDVLRYDSIDPAKVFVTYEAASRDFQPSAVDWQTLTPFGLSPNTPFIFHFGRTDKRKNVENMVTAFSRLPTRLKSHVRFLVFINDKPPQFESLRMFIESHRADNVHLFGGVSGDALRSLYNAALGLMFVSFAEGFGLPALEALQSGCPVLTSPTSALPEVVGDAALYANPHDINSISAAMERLIEDAALRKELQKKGIEQAAQFSWERTAQLTIEGYRSVLKNS